MTDSVLLNFERPGTYQLVVDAQQGAGNHGPRNPFRNVDVTIIQGVVALRWIIVAFVLTAGLAIWGIARRTKHSVQRKTEIGLIDSD